MPSSRRVARPVGLVTIAVLCLAGGPPALGARASRPHVPQGPHAAGTPALPEAYPEYAKALKRVTVNGTELAYVEKGKGQTVVLVHGALGDLRVWGPVFDTLAARYRVVAYSMRGHFPGVWQVDGPDYTADQHAQDLMAFLKAIKASRVHLVGYSYGGRVAAVVAARRPDMVRSVVLAEPAIVSLLDGTPAATTLRQQGATVAMAVIKAMGRKDTTGACRALVDSVAGPGTFDALPPQQRAQLEDNASTVVPMLALDGQARFDCADAKRIACPALLVRGAGTQEPWKAIVQKLGECLPVKTVVEIPNAGHLMVAENPEAFGRAVAEFLAKR